MREGFTVQGVITDGEAVSGIQGRFHGDTTVTARARLVVGADGLHPVIARVVKAPIQQEQPALSFTYYSYFDDVPVEGVEGIFRPGCAYIVFPTNNDQSCVAFQAPIAGFHSFRKDIEGNFFTEVNRIPSREARVHARNRTERWQGTADLPNFLRKPFGPGWALVGDSGYHKDPITAVGISDAFRDAELLVDAIDAGFSGRRPLDEAMAHYEQQRNEIATPMFWATCHSARFAPFPEAVFASRRAARDRASDT